MMQNRFNILLRLTSLFLLTQICIAFVPGHSFARMSRSQQLVINAKRVPSEGTPLPLITNDELKIKSPTNRDKTIQNMLDNLPFVREVSTPQIKMEDDPELPIVFSAVKAADGRKGRNINAMRIAHLTEMTQYMIIAEGNSPPQTGAIVSAIEDELIEKYGLRVISTDGDAKSGWIAMDYGSLIVHVMSSKMRRFYKLEGRWKDAEPVNLSSILIPESGDFDSNSMANDGELSMRQPEEEEAEKEEEDPFWK